jgi:outer membrane lipoprotein SlyB
MKKLKAIASLVAIATLTGCGTGPDAQTGTVLGGLGGAAVGGIIGNQSGRGLEGAAIGGGIGAVAGNVLGNARDERRNQ